MVPSTSSCTYQATRRSPSTVPEGLVAVRSVPVSELLYDEDRNWISACAALGNKTNAAMATTRRVRLFLQPEFMMAFDILKGVSIRIFPWQFFIYNLPKSSRRPLIKNIYINHDIFAFILFLSHAEG